LGVREGGGASRLIFKIVFINSSSTYQLFHELVKGFNELQLERESNVLIGHIHPDVDRRAVQQIRVDRPQIRIRHRLEDPFVQAFSELLIKPDHAPRVAVLHSLQGGRLVVEVDRRCYVGIEKTEISAGEVLQVFVRAGDAHGLHRDGALFGDVAVLAGFSVVLVVDNGKGQLFWVLTDGHAEQADLEIFAGTIKIGILKINVSHHSFCEKTKKPIISEKTIRLSLVKKNGQ
jgi:hypothetical protein